MTMTVHDRSRAISTFRYLSVWMMESIAGWTPVTPQMEAKVMFGRHIWDHAQMADALGKRTFELRKPEQHSTAPGPAYLDLLEAIRSEATTASRVRTLYEGLLPGLIARYRAYVATTDPILDEPSVVIIERIVRELERHRQEGAALCDELKLAPGKPNLAAREAAIAEFIAAKADA